MTRLEKAINQKTPFKSEYHRTTANLLFTHNWLAMNLKKFLKPFDCTLQQYNVLRILKGAKEPISTSEIRNRMVEKMADASRLVERLCTKGLVNREACCGDKRLVDVSLTDEGLRFLKEMEGIDNYIQNLFSNLSEEELKQLNSLLDKLH